MKNFIVAAALAALIGSGLPGTAAAEDHRGGKGGVKETHVNGTISAINVGAGTVSITSTAGVTTVVTATATTKLERNGRKATLAAFKVGDRASAESKGGVLKEIEARGV